jgi:hypothetical protein
LATTVLCRLARLRSFDWGWRGANAVGALLDDGDRVEAGDLSVKGFAGALVELLHRRLGAGAPDAVNYPGIAAHPMKLGLQGAGEFSLIDRRRLRRRSDNLAAW